MTEKSRSKEISALATSDESPDAREKEALSQKSGAERKRVGNQCKITRWREGKSFRIDDRFSVDLQEEQRSHPRGKHLSWYNRTAWLANAIAIWKQHWFDLQARPRLHVKGRTRTNLDMQVITFCEVVEKRVALLRRRLIVVRGECQGMV